MELDVSAEIVASLGSRLDQLQAAIERLQRPYCRSILAAKGGAVSAGGAVQFAVFDVPDKMKFTLRKFILWGDNHNPSTGSVYNNPAAWCGLFHGQPSNVNLADFFPYPEAANGQVIPYTKEYARDIIVWESPDNVQFSGVGLPAGENVTCFVFGDLEEATKKPHR